MDLARILCAPVENPVDAQDAPLRPSLPPAVQRKIFASLIDELTQEDETDLKQGISVPVHLRAAACVSKEWSALVHDVAAESVLARLRVPVVLASRSDLLELRRRVTLQRRFLTSLVIESVPLFGAIGEGQWEAAFCLVPRLEKLSLRPVREHTLPRLAEIVRAAGRQCDEVQTLRLPGANRSYGPCVRPSQEILDGFEEALYGALGAWSRNGMRKGVRHLHVGMHDFITDVSTARAYVHKLMDLCPAIEEIDGYTCSLTACEDMHADEQWFLDLATWTRFCASVSTLTHFDWAMVPFATAFFDVFGQHPKPHLKALQFTPLVNWRRKAYMRGLDSRTWDALTERGYGPQAVEAYEALRACPNLVDLEVRWSYSVDEEREDDGADDEIQVMNPEIFGDVFCEAVATNCRHLQVFTMHALIDDNESNHVIQSFTDRAMRARDVAAAKRPESSARWRYHIDVGDESSRTPDHTFYKIVETFLQRAAENKDALQCENHTVFLQLTNKSPGTIDKFWGEKYLKEMKSLIDSIKEARPNAAISLTTSGYNRGRFKRMEDFAFSIGPDPEPIMSIDEEEQVDDYVWNRVEETEPLPVQALRHFYASGGQNPELVFATLFGDDSY